MSVNVSVFPMRLEAISFNREARVANAEADVQFLTRIHGMHAATVEDHKGLAATVERKVSKLQGALLIERSHRDVGVDVGKELRLPTLWAGLVLPEERSLKPSTS